MEDNKVWVVYGPKNTPIAAFSNEDDTEFFVINVYPDQNTKIKKRFKETAKLLVDFYHRENIFVYEVSLIRDGWLISFIGYNMDMADRRGIVYNPEPECYTTYILAKDYKTALNMGKQVIIQAIDNNEFVDNYANSEYNVPYQDESEVETKDALEQIRTAMLLWDNESYKSNNSFEAGIYTGLSIARKLLLPKSKVTLWQYNYYKKTLEMMEKK